MDSVEAVEIDANDSASYSFNFGLCGKGGSEKEEGSVHGLYYWP